MAPPRRERRAIRLMIGAVSVGLTVALAPVAASALWQTTTTAPAAPLAAGTLTTPVATCTSVPAGGGSAAYAQISWPAITGADAYTITLRNSTGSASTVQATGVTSTTYDIKGNLVTNLGVLLTALLGGGAIYVTVTATNNTWVSAVSTGTPIVLSSVIGGLLGGFTCQ